MPPVLFTVSHPLRSPFCLPGRAQYFSSSRAQLGLSPDVLNLMREMIMAGFFFFFLLFPFLFIAAQNRTESSQRKPGTNLIFVTASQQWRTVCDYIVCDNIVKHALSTSPSVGTFEGWECAGKIDVDFVYNL